MRYRKIALALVAATALAVAAPAHAAEGDALPPGVVARVYGRDIRESELLDRILQTYRYTERGRAALNELVDDFCVHAEAERRAVTVSEAEIDAYVRDWDERIKRQSGGQASIEDVYKEASSREEFLATAHEFLLRQKMARADLGSPPGEDLSEARMKLWLTSVRKRAGVAYEGLPDGVVARIGTHEVLTADLARRLRAKLPVEMVAAAGNELVIAAAAEHEAAAQGVTISDADVELALADLRQRFAEEPQVRGTGVTFDQFLQQSRGFGEAELRADRVFRARIALRRMVERGVGDDDVRSFWEAHREAYGERALVREIFVPASDSTPDAKTPDGFRLPTFRQAFDIALEAKAEVFEAAGLHLPEAQRPAGGLALAITRVAKRRVRDQEAQARAGEPVAWTRPMLQGQRALETAAFDGTLGQVQGPVRGDAGYHLVLVEERRPAPSFDEVRARIRGDLVQDGVNRFEIRFRGETENVQRSW